MNNSVNALKSAEAALLDDVHKFDVKKLEEFCKNSYAQTDCQQLRPYEPFYQQGHPMEAYPYV